MGTPTPSKEGPDLALPAPRKHTSLRSTPGDLCTSKCWWWGISSGAGLSAGLARASLCDAGCAPDSSGPSRAGWSPRSRRATSRRKCNSGRPPASPRLPTHSRAQTSQRYGARREEKRRVLSDELSKQNASQRTLLKNHARETDASYCMGSARKQRLWGLWPSLARRCN